ncbi:hypothetical protein C8F01DRAFT_1081426 [Mycena amicta]|nr:hypothetical protein C8F01DRAFT_1081426 [Mycena amicta]
MTRPGLNRDPRTNLSDEMDESMQVQPGSVGVKPIKAIPKRPFFVNGTQFCQEKRLFGSTSVHVNILQNTRPFEPNCILRSAINTIPNTRTLVNLPHHHFQWNIGIVVCVAQKHIICALRPTADRSRACFNPPQIPTVVLDLELNGPAPWTELQQKHSPYGIQTELLGLLVASIQYYCISIENLTQKSPFNWIRRVEVSTGNKPEEPEQQNKEEKGWTEIRGDWLDPDGPRPVYYPRHLKLEHSAQVQPTPNIGLLQIERSHKSTELLVPAWNCEYRRVMDSRKREHNALGLCE